MVWCAHRSAGVRRVRLGHPGKEKKAESLVQMPQVGRVYGNSLLIASLFLGKEETEFSAVSIGEGKLCVVAVRRSQKVNGLGKSNKIVGQHMGSAPSGM